MGRITKLEKRHAKKLKKLKKTLEDYGLLVNVSDEDMVDAEGKVIDPTLRQQLAEDMLLDEPLVTKKKRKKAK